MTIMTNVLAGATAGSVTMLFTDDVMASAIMGLIIGLGAGLFNVMMAIRENSFKINIAMTDLIGGGLVGVLVLTVTNDEFSAKVAYGVTFVAALLAFNIMPILKNKRFIEGAVERVTGVKPKQGGSTDETE